MKSLGILFLILIPVIHESQAWRARWKKPPCDPVHCEPKCDKVFDPVKGCPKCVCEELKCAPPLCPPKCKVQIDFKGPCPGCDCEEEIKEFLDHKICDPPKCGPDCEIESIYDGPCPGCKCEIEDEKKEEIFSLKKKVECDPPKCDPGCDIEIDFDGPCPGCKCDKSYDDEGGDDEELKDSMDLKKVMCAPPKCDPGCEIETIFDGPCPGCKCIDKHIVEEELDKCPPVLDCKEPPLCDVEIDEKGCKKCVCKPICDKPLCDKPGCWIKQVPDACPMCHCLKRRPWRNWKS